MPIIRCDIPDGFDRETKDAAYRVLYEAIAETWAREHIWIALSDAYMPPDRRQILVTVDLRPGRGGEAARLRELFDRVQSAFEPLFGIGPEDMIVLVRDFPQEACLSGGAPLPPLSSLTPELT